jgi:transketolase
VEFADIACIVQIGAVLYSDFLQHNPKDPQWLKRDRFVLSGGHGTLLKTVTCAAVP